MLTFCRNTKAQNYSHWQIEEKSVHGRESSIFERVASGKRRREVAVGRRVFLPSTNRGAEPAPRRMRQTYAENLCARQRQNTCVCWYHGGGNMMHRVVLVSVTARFIYIFCFLRKVRSGLTWNYVLGVHITYSNLFKTLDLNLNLLAGEIKRIYLKNINSKYENVLVQCK